MDGACSTALSHNRFDRESPPLNMSRSKRVKLTNRFPKSAQKSATMIRYLLSRCLPIAAKAITRQCRERCCPEMVLQQSAISVVVTVDTVKIVVMDKCLQPAAPEAYR